MVEKKNKCIYGSEKLMSSYDEAYTLSSCSLAHFGLCLVLVCLIIVLHSHPV